MLADQEVEAGVPVDYDQQIVDHEERSREVRQMGPGLRAVAELPQPIVLEKLQGVEGRWRGSEIEDHVRDVEGEDRQDVQPEKRGADVVMI